MLRFHDRVGDDLLGLEVLQIDNGNARIGLVVDEQILVRRTRRWFRRSPDGAYRRS